MKANILKYGGVAASRPHHLRHRSIAIGAAGRNTVQNNLSAEKIVGTPDMTPKAIKAAGTEAGLKNVDHADLQRRRQGHRQRDRCPLLRRYMRIHALEATGGLVYAEMGRYLDANGKPTDNEKAAAIDPEDQAAGRQPGPQPVVNETALAPR